MIKDIENANNHPPEMELFPTRDGRTPEKFYTYVALNYMQPLGIDPHSPEGAWMMQHTAECVAKENYLGISFIEGFVDAIMDGHGKPVDYFTAPNHIWRPIRSEQDRKVRQKERAKKVEAEVYLNPHIPMNNNYSFRASVGMAGSYPVIRYTLQHNGNFFTFSSVDPPECFDDANRYHFYELAEIGHITVRGIKSTLYPPDDDALVRVRPRTPTN